MEQSTMPPPVPPPAPPAPQPFKASGPQDERMWGMFCHLSVLIGLIGVPGLIGPLVIWLVKREQYGLVNDQGKEALNFQLTMLIGFLVCIPLLFVCGIGAILAVVLGLVDLVFVIIAAIKANEGVCYRYPMCIRFIK
jgi:uncharacterized Tic20 family protein